MQDENSGFIKLLTGNKTYFDKNDFTDQLFNMLLKNGIIVENHRNELEEIREQYWTARGATPIVLTLTTTMDCNLGCYYCYESRTKHKLEFADIDEILRYLKNVFQDNPKRSLHVDWYGGEPLLNIAFLEKASYELQEYCTTENISYHASIISNGTVWPENPAPFVKSHKIRQVQISFDGLKDNHNKRRRYNREYSQAENNSFDTAIELVEKLLECVHVDVRFNIDWNNKHDIIEFIDYIDARGWFNKSYPAVFQPARISAYSERSAFMQSKQLTLEEFDSIKGAVKSRLKNIASVEESEIPDGFPFPKTSVCAALAQDSFVVGADKLVYRCGLQVGETKRAIGSLHNQSTLEFKDKKWWEDFDPTYLPTCSQCSFLPVCHGGCPKKQLENDKISTDEQSKYWKTNLGKIITSYIGLELISDTILTELEQYREGY